MGVRPMKRMKLALQDGAALLIAHPWKGTVISEIRADPKVSVLVWRIY
jgi:hypothetical protein